MAHAFPAVKARFFDQNGAPLVGGKLYSYAATTNTPQQTFTGSDGAIANSNPVVLDSNGEADIWLGDSAYKFVLTDANDVVQWTKDNVKAFNPGDLQFVTIANIVDGILAATTAGRAKMADGFVTLAKLTDGILAATTAGRLKMADGFVTIEKLADGILAATTAGRAKMADGFITVAKLADGILTADATGRAKMVDGFVNAAKISDGSVGPSKLTAYNYALQTPGTGVDSTTSGTLRSVNNATYPITTNGRPVKITMVPDGSSNPAKIYADGRGAFSLRRNGVEIGRHAHGPGYGAVSSLVFWDAPGAGTHSYQLLTAVESGTVVNVEYAKLLLEEQ